MNVSTSRSSYGKWNKLLNMCERGYQENPAFLYSRVIWACKVYNIVSIYTPKISRSDIDEMLSSIPDRYFSDKKIVPLRSYTLYKVMLSFDKNNINYDEEISTKVMELDLH